MRCLRRAARLDHFLPGLSLLAALLLACPLVADEPGQPPVAKKEQAGKASGPLPVETRLNDDSTSQATLREERVEIVSPYGKLVIPIREVHRIEFATRIPEEIARRCEAAIAKLGSPEFRIREEATAELVKLREKAYPALQRAAKSADKEVARRADNLLEKLRENIPEEMLEFREFDVVYTAHSKIAGRIVGTTFKATTAKAANIQLKFADMHSLRNLTVPDEPDPRTVAADPGTLTNFQNQVGKTLFFNVTGAANGSVWGSDVYTTDSTLAVAAVHAGVLKVGQTGRVKVKIVLPPASFEGTTRNGVTTGAWGPYPSAYRVSK